jgi:hypothetical protein
MLRRILDWVDKVQTAEGVLAWFGWRTWFVAAASSIVVGAVAWLTHQSLPAIIIYALSAFAVVGILFIVIIELLDHFKTRLAHDSPPDLEITVGDFVTGLAWVPVPQLPPNPPMAAAVWVTIINRKKTVSLRFAVRDPETGETLRAAGLLTIRSYSHGPQYPGIKFIDDPEILPAPTERHGNVKFYWPSQHGGAMKDHESFFNKYREMMITDSIAGKTYTIDLTKTTPIGQPFRRVIKFGKAENEQAPAPLDGEFANHKLESKDAWLTLWFGPLVFGFVDKEQTVRSLSVEIKILNRHVLRKLSLAFVLTEDGKSELPNAKEIELVVRGFRGTVPGLRDLFNPVAVGPQEEVSGHIWFVSENAMPLRSIVIRDGITGQYWTHELDRETLKGPRNAGY